MKKTLVMLQLCLLTVSCKQATEESTPDSPSIATGTGLKYVVTTFTTMRLVPSNAPTVTHPYDNKQMIQNWMGMLRRGMQVQVLAMEPGWYQVRVENGGEGWMATDNLLPVKKVQEVTVLKTVPGYNNEMLTGRPVGSVVAGELLFVLQTTPQATQVQVENVGTVWIATSAVVQDATEVGMAHLITEAKEAAQRRDIDEAGEALDEARLKFPTSQLFDVIAEHVDIAHMHGIPSMPTAAHVSGTTDSVIQMDPAPLGIPLNSPAMLNANNTNTAEDTGAAAPTVTP